MLMENIRKVRTNHRVKFLYVYIYTYILYLRTKGPGLIDFPGPKNSTNAFLYLPTAHIQKCGALIKERIVLPGEAPKIPWALYFRV